MAGGEGEGVRQLVFVEFLTHSGVSRILNEGGGGGGFFIAYHTHSSKNYTCFYRSFDRSAPGFRDHVYPDWVWSSNVVLY